MGFVDEMTVDWLTHETDMDIEDVVQLAYTAVIAVPVHGLRWPRDRPRHRRKATYVSLRPV